MVLFVEHMYAQLNDIRLNLAQLDELGDNGVSEEDFASIFLQNHEVLRIRALKAALSADQKLLDALAQEGLDAEAAYEKDPLDEGETAWSPNEHGNTWFDLENDSSGSSSSDSGSEGEGGREEEEEEE